MLDLDALVGDLAASRANKERSLTGSRQSRFLNQHPSLEVSGGKRLQIQGFIPIVGVKDVADDVSSVAIEPNASDDQHRPNSANELPYAQSSLGHASFGVQRYLSNDQQAAASQQVDAKFSGASVVDSLKRPIKKLTSYMQVDQNAQQAAGQNCLCVPFYMCKNGYISESSLGKSQIQQMIAQQQQQQQAAASPQIEMKSGQLMPQRQVSPTEAQKEPQYADSYVPVDERSFEKELITVAPDNLNQSSQSLSQSDQSLATLLNSTTSESGLLDNDEYTQDILGRMLGLKSSDNNSPARNQDSASSGGVCGLLRSCCNIPVHLIPSQLDMANEQLMVQYSNNPNKQLVSKQAELMRGGFNQVQVMMAQQRFQQKQDQQPVMQQQQKLPYGFPIQMAQQQQQSMLMNPLNSPNSLVHRSNNYPPQTSNRYPLQQHQQQVSQFTRVASAPLQQMQHNQQQFYPSQQQQAKAALHSSLNYQHSTRSLPVQSLQGSRKILDGRCGLRQASGIAGRVQNLQYHESSAEFGEYPAQAAILKRLSGSDNLFVCGGTLISQYWVATAAHCIKKHAQSELKIRLGEWDVHRDDEFYPFVEKEVRDLVVHPEFVAGNLVNDIALLRLDSPVDPSLPHVNPACLPALDETFTRQRCWVTGWGKDSFGQKGSFQSVLREVELPVVGQSECQSALRSTRLGPHYRLHSGFICAGGEGGRDACEGDGGSGLYCIQDGVIKVAGLVSWGIGCGQAGVPGVYVNLAHYRTWIENIISIDEDIYSPYSNMLAANGPISERSNNATETEVATSSSTTQPPTTTTTTTTATNS